MGLNLEGKFYEDKSGTVVKVNTIDGNIAHLDTGSRIAVERLLDNNFFTEQIDPNSFFDRAPSYLNDINSQLTTLDTNNISDNAAPSQVKVIEQAEDSMKTVTIQPDDIEARKKEMMENAARIREKSLAANEAIEKSINEHNRNLDGVTVEGVAKPIQMQQQAYVPPTPVEDPIYAMFSQVKRSANFSVNVKLSEKIPKKDFIKMWEDSYEVSIIDYLVDEFTEKLLKDPTMIKDQVRKALKAYVYPPKRRKTT
jgi:hypothetical protein